MFIGCALPHALRAHRSFTRGTARGLLSAVVCMLGLAFAPAAWASTFYVSPAGKNSNAGTNSSAPWQTIAAVNKHVFQPGDTILFKAGDSFTGSIYMSPSEPGTASSPITVGSYGSGTATINAGSRDGFEAYDTGGFLIQNLKFTGSGSTKNSSSGVIFYNDLAGNVSEPHIYLAQVTVDGFGQQGVSIGGGNGASGYTDVNLSHVTAYDNGLNGIIFYGASEYANHDVYVGYSSAYDNYGKSGLAANSGSGIELGSVDGGTVEYSTAYGNGASNTATSGPVGIWTYDSNAVTIQYCESYDNQTAGGDGDGFDIDQNTTNSTVQYSYAHGNDGAGILLDQNANATGWGGNTVRFNISENDGRTIGFGGITLYGHVTGAQIYNNTVYTSTAPTGVAKGIYIFTSGSDGVPAKVSFWNNIVDTAGTAQSLDVTSAALAGATDLSFVGNDYYRGTSAVSIGWGSSTYTALPAWRAASAEETVNGSPVGLSVNPMLTSPGQGGTPSSTALTTISAYTLMQGSPLVAAGLNLPTTFGVNAGSTDFWGSALGAAANIGAD